MTIKLIAVSRTTILEAQSRLLGCEVCSPEAEIPFDWLLDEVMGNSGGEADYVQSEPAKCPKCYGQQCTLAFYLFRAFCRTSAT